MAEIAAALFVAAGLMVVLIVFPARSNRVASLTDTDGTDTDGRSTSPAKFVFALEMLLSLHSACSTSALQVVEVPLKLVVGSCLSVGLLVSIFFGATAGIVCIAVLLTGAILLRSHLIELAKRDSEEELRQIVRLLSHTVRGGQSVGSALRQIETDGPVATQLNQTLANNDGSLVGGLQQWNAECHIEGHELLCAALILGSESGAGAADLLDRVSMSLSESAAEQAERLSQTAQARTSAAVVAALPVVFLVGTSLLEPRILALLFTSNVGTLIVGVGLALELAGLWWMRSILRGSS